MDKAANAPKTESSLAEETQPFGTYSDQVLRIHLFITPAHDKLFCECEILPEQSAAQVTAKSILALIPAEFAKDLISEEVLADIASQLRASKPTTRRRIAKAVPMSPGRDGRLLLLVKKFAGFNGAVQQDIVDNRFMRHFDNVETGAVIGRIYPPVPGKPGRDIFGKRIESPPVKTPKTTVDLNTLELRPHQSIGSTSAWDELIARSSGYVTEANGKLTIAQTLEIRQNIDYRIGDIEFLGHLQIHGDVRTGFTIRARESVIVHGDSSGANITSPRGTITVKGHVAGSDSTVLSGADLVLSNMVEVAAKSPATLSAQGDITLHSADGMIIESASNLIVAKELRNCLARIRGVVMMPQGHLLDSQIFTVCGVEAGVIGSDAGSRTIIHLVSDIEATAEFAQLARQLEENVNAQELIRIYLGPFAQHSINDSRLKADHRAKIHELRKKLTILEKTEKELFEEQSKLLQSAKHNRTYRVSFKKVLYAGSEIHAAGEHYLVSETKQGPGTIEFNPQTVAFELKPYAAIECDIT